MKLPGISFYLFSRSFDLETSRALRNVYDYVDEIIYTTTKEPLTSPIDFDHKSKIRTYHHQYKTFSEIRNFCISKTQFQWILSLDSDEEFSETLLKNLKQYTNTAHESFKFNRIYRYNSTILRDPFPQLRLFKYRPEISYVGTVHEQLINLKSTHILRSWKSVIKHHKTFQQMLDSHKKYNDLLNKELQYAIDNKDQDLIDFTNLRIWSNNNLDNISNFHDLNLMKRLKSEHKKRKEQFLKTKKNYHLEMNKLEKMYLEHKHSHLS
ncbi:MAG: hypothetical protein NTZ55_01990 [Candidatus Roizmanbacteria bacterium]|nr:hypothetical protein [Candidatus Roizmanbacteria bacterium]